MPIDANQFHFHLHFPPDPRIDQILTGLQQVQQSVNHMGAQMAADDAAIANLTAAAKTNENAEQSAILLLNQIGAQLVAAINSGNPAAIQAVADTLNNDAGTLAAAVTANTPAATTPPPPPGSGPTAPPADTTPPPVTPVAPAADAATTPPPDAGATPAPVGGAPSTDANPPGSAPPAIDPGTLSETPPPAAV